MGCRSPGYDGRAANLKIAKFASYGAARWSADEGREVGHDCNPRGRAGCGNFDRLRCGYDVLFHGLTSLCLTVGFAGYPADFPPSTESTWPVIKAALSEARKTRALAISSGFPTRPSGTLETRPAFLSALPVKRLSIPVSIGPG